MKLNYGKTIERGVQKNDKKTVSTKPLFKSVTVCFVSNMLKALQDEIYAFFREIPLFSIFIVCQSHQFMSCKNKEKIYTVLECLI